MSTTTIRIDKALQTRIRAAAKAAGTSAHGFMLEAIEEKTRRAELQQSFHCDAVSRMAGIAESGQTVPWKDMRDYLHRRAAGKSAAQPKARKLTNT